MASASLLFLGFLVLAFHEVMSQQNDSLMEKDELFGLYEVMNSILDDPSWPETHPNPCTETPWPGVECEIGGYPEIFHVTKIHVGPDILSPPCKSSAKIPESLLKLPYLKTLSFFNCFTTSKVSLSPSLFQNPSSLEHLTLVSNPSLSGTIPSNISNLVSLKVLCLSRNNLRGEIPKEIGRLVNLQQLDLSYNNFTGLVPEEIGGLKSLTIFDLSSNNFQGEIPPSMGQLQLLQKLDLSSNNFHGRLPSEIKNLHELVLLDLSQNSLNGPIPENFTDLEKLQYLIIQGNPINTSFPSFIRVLENLKAISFSSCGLEGPIPSTLFSDLGKLSALSLDNNNLNGTVPLSLSTLQNLDLLNLSQNRLSGELLFPEDFINKLGERLDVSGNLGLCKKNSSCLVTKVPRCNETLAKENADDSSKGMKPSWDQGSITSCTYGHEDYDSKLVFLALPLLILQVLG